jgi:hypothetical protein
MAAWDSADLLSKLDAVLNRPATDNSLSTAQKYVFLTEAQAHYYEQFAIHFPWVLYGTPSAMSTSDSGATYTFAGSAFPIGSVVIRHGRSGPVLRPGPEWDDGADYHFEGNKIRIPGGRTRTYGQGLYAQFITPPSTLDGSNAPTLSPEFARMLIVYNAAGKCAVRLKQDPNPFYAMELEKWESVRDVLKKQLYGHGMSAHGADGGRYWITIGGGY